MWQTRHVFRLRKQSEQTRKSRKKVASVFRPFFSIDRIVRVRPTVLGASASSSLKKSANSSHLFCVCRGFSTKHYVLQARRSKAPSRLGYWWLTTTGAGKQADLVSKVSLVRSLNLSVRVLPLSWSDWLVPPHPAPISTELKARKGVPSARTEWCLRRSNQHSVSSQCSCLKRLWSGPPAKSDALLTVLCVLIMFPSSVEPASPLSLLFILHWCTLS